MVNVVSVTNQGRTPVAAAILLAVLSGNVRLGDAWAIPFLRSAIQDVGAKSLGITFAGKSSRFANPLAIVCAVLAIMGAVMLRIVGTPMSHVLSHASAVLLLAFASGRAHLFGICLGPTLIDRLSLVGIFSSPLAVAFQYLLAVRRVIAKVSLMGDFGVCRITCVRSGFSTRLAIAMQTIRLLSVGMKVFSCCGVDIAARGAAFQGGFHRAISLLHDSLTECGKAVRVTTFRELPYPATEL